MQIGTLTVLNDCYNANPASMKNALAMLHNLRPDGDANRRRRLVFICGEMAELGPQTRGPARGIGPGGGRGRRRSARDGRRTAPDYGPSGPRRPPDTTSRREVFDDTLSACNHLQEFIQKDDIILVKGSRTARLEQVVETLIKDFG